jgi:Amt family ammonium transporter
VLYQPIVAATTCELVGFEALVRWDRTGHGRLSPAEFLPVAEDTGLIVPLGRHVLSEACTQLAAWQLRRSERPPFVAVNLSPRQLLSPELVDDVREAIECCALDPGNLWLELPETLLVHDTPQLVSLLNKLRDLGVNLALDDFGTGFSSLTHLRFLPVGVVKIDRSFIFELGRNEQGTTIVGSVISLAHALGMRVIAEGVETAEQLEILRALDCDWIQGFYFSTPLLPTHANQVLASGRLRG